MFQVDACQLPANWTSVASQLPALGASPDGVILHKVFVSHDDLAAAAAATTAAGKLQQDECLVDSTASLSLGQCCDASRNTEKLDCSSDDSQQQASGEARQLQSSYAAGAGQLPSGCEAEAAMQLLMNLLKTVPVAGQDNQQASQHADAVDMCTQDRHAVCGGNGDEHGDTLVGCNGKDHVDTNLSLSCLSVQQMLTQLIAQAAADGSSNSNDECLLSSGSSNLTGSSTSTPTTSSSSSDSSSSTAGQGPPARPGRYVQIPEVVEVKNHCPFVFRCVVCSMMKCCLVEHRCQSCKFIVCHRVPPPSPARARAPPQKCASTTTGGASSASCEIPSCIGARYTRLFVAYKVAVCCIQLKQHVCV